MDADLQTSPAWLQDIEKNAELVETEKSRNSDVPGDAEDQQLFGKVLISGDSNCPEGHRWRTAGRLPVSLLWLSTSWVMLDSETETQEKTRRQ